MTKNIMKIISIAVFAIISFAFAILCMLAYCEGYNVVAALIAGLYIIILVACYYLSPEKRQA